MTNPLADPEFRHELVYVGLIFGLFVLPRFLQRYRIPSAITSFLLGAVVALGFNALTSDNTIHLLATFGIVGLFLFAGLEVDLPELRRGSGVLIQHLLGRLVLVAAAAWAAMLLFNLELRPACLVALAILTPSTGFILGSLDTFGLSDEERFWVKSKAIGSELLALVLLFAILRSDTLTQFGLSFLALVVLIGALPLLFRAFARWIVPYAPRSEFAFLLMMAVVCAFTTRRLGVYYLVGAFMVGMAAQGFRRRLPSMTSSRTLHAVEVFASFFAPFYFFGSGLQLHRADFVLESVVVGAAMVAVAVPAQSLLIALHRRWRLGEPLRRSRSVAISLLPTLVFTLVLAEILRDRFHISPALFGGLIIYALVTTLIPGLVLRVPPAEFDRPHLSGGLLDEPEPRAGEQRT